MFSILAYLFSPLPAFAGENIILGETLFKAGVSALTSEETKKLLVHGSSVETYAATTGSVRYWKNEADGKFIASRQGGTGNARSQGHGEWKVTDTGQYCVVIEWRTARGSPDNTENWCRVVYRFDSEFYLAPKDLATNLDKKYSVIRVN